MGIRYKIIIFISISFVVLGVFLDSFISSKISQAFNQRLVDKAQKVAYLLEQTEQDGILNENLFGRLSRFVEVQSTDKEVKGIAVLKSLEDVYASNISEINNYTQQFDRIENKEEYQRNDSVFYLKTPIYSNSIVDEEKQISCTVLIELYTREVDENLSEILITLRYIILFITISILVLVIIFAESIVKTILGLVEQSKIISSGNYTNFISSKRKDELGTLARSLNDMRENILSSTKKIIEFNKKMSDSIYYAETIQNALLPEDSFYADNFQDYFYIYKPKDIISGDFYWSHKDKDGNLYVCAGDCTGHGVSGAFMTMIANALLNQVIVEENISSPELILTRLRELLINTLNKDLDSESDSGEQLKNGMDVSFCLFEANQKILQFSAANQVMILIRDEEVQLVKGDAQPIGLHTKMVDFTKHEIELQKNDQLYLFSDGYIDQFGGPSFKRYKRGKFVKTMKNICTQSMTSQKKALEQEFEDWKGESEQVDDIIVMGFKI